MKGLINLFIICLLFSCESSRNEDSEKPETDSLAFVVKAEQADLNPPPTEEDHIESIAPEFVDSKGKITVLDSSKYSKKFLQDLLETPDGYEFILVDSVMTIKGQGDVVFPSLIAINQKRKFSGKRGDKTFDLIIGRLNYSTIAYELRIYVNDKSTEYNNGTADLGSMFFLASEIDEDDKTGTSYSSSEYWDEGKDCTFSVRIGVSDENGKLLAKIIRNCKDKSKNISLEDCPTLRVK